MPYSSESTEHGFTLVELLVVILIIGILAAIAVPAFLNQRKVAVEASMKSDLKNASTEMLSELAMKGSYPATLPTSVKTSDGNTVRLGGQPAGNRMATPLDKIPTTVETHIFDIALPNGQTDRVGYFFDAFSDDGIMFSKQSRVVLFDPDNPNGEYLGGFATDHVLVNDSIHYRVQTTCLDGKTTTYTAAKKVVSGTPMVADDLLIRNPTCNTNPSKLVQYSFAPTKWSYAQFQQAGTSWGFQSNWYHPATLKKVEAKSNSPMQDFCLDVVNSGIGSTFKYTSSNREISTGTCPV